jgi:predicted chitinase
MPLVTIGLLRAAEPSNPDSYYATLVDSMCVYAERYAIDTPLRLAHFLSQIGHESGFRIIEENGSYSVPRMRQVFGCKGGSKNYDAQRDDCAFGRLREKLWTERVTYSRNPRNLLSYVYASRLGNGDEGTGDGFHYRGRGMIQLTGRTNYGAFTAAHNARNPEEIRDFVDDPDLLLKVPKFGVESAY